MEVVSAAKRQVLLNEYLNITGRNSLVTDEFISWLSEQPDHPLYSRVFRSAEVLILKAQRSIVREMFHGLVITEFISPENQVKVSMPMFVTCGEVKRSEYIPFNPDSDQARKGLISDGLTALKAWHHRYAGVTALHKCPIDAEIGAAIAKLETAIAEP